MFPLHVTRSDLQMIMVINWYSNCWALATFLWKDVYSTGTESLTEEHEEQHADESGHDDQHSQAETLPHTLFVSLSLS